MKNLKQLCLPRQSVFDKSRRDVVLDITDLTEGKIDPTAFKEARQMDITTETPERFALAVKDSFPFHPAIKDLYARFKENPGFSKQGG